MIIDVHTHVFPPRMVAARQQLAASDAAFAEMYGDAAARMATAEDLLASMDGAGVDISVAAGFWWRDAAIAEEHAAYLLDVAAASDGRIVPFVPLASSGEAGGAAPDSALRGRLAELVAGGARGLGEVRPGNAGGNGARNSGGDTDVVLAAAGEEGLAALVHGSEEVGHRYPGKGGGYTPGALWTLMEACAAPSTRVIAAHWGGGFPFYALMPEVRDLLDGGRLAFDTAATPLLYETAVFERSFALVGVEHVLWGSDYPLRDQAADRAAVEAAVEAAVGATGGAEAREAVLGGNAARFLSLDAP
ncbi:MAG: amidohydrolase family protein [Dehalococcoidia bacterium]